MRGRRLVAERLAAAGRQHDERVAAFDDALDGALLQWQESIVTPDATNRLVQELSLDDAAMIADGSRRRLGPYSDTSGLSGALQVTSRRTSRTGMLHP